MEKLAEAKPTEYPDYIWDDVTLTSLDLLREWLNNRTYNYSDCQMGMKRLGAYFTRLTENEDGTTTEVI